MGGFNSQAVDYVCGLTPKQVAAWYVGPLVEAQKQTETPGKATAASEPAKPGEMTAEEFKAAFMVPHYADKPAEWWAEKHAAYEAARVASEG